MPNMVSQTLRYSYLALGLFLVLACLAAAFGPSWWRDYSLRTHMVGDWLAPCPPGDLRFTCNSAGENYYHVYGYVDSQKEILGVDGDDWGPGGATSSIVPGEMYPVPVLSTQKADIERLITALPAHTMWFWQPYDFDHNIYFSLWRDGARQIYVYPKNQLPAPATALFKYFGPDSVTAFLRTNAGKG
jgi:hypothetical protein